MIDSVKPNYVSIRSADFEFLILYFSGERAFRSSDFPISSLPKYVLCRFDLMSKISIGLSQ